MHVTIPFFTLLLCWPLVTSGADNCPPLGIAPPDVTLNDVNRFPSLGCCEEWTEFFLRYEMWLSDQRDSPRAEAFQFQRQAVCDWYSKAGVEAHWAWDRWDDARIARNESLYDREVRLNALRRLQNRLGEKAYRAGWLPLVPQERWRERE
jgi:hypothetical protein